MARRPIRIMLLWGPLSLVVAAIPIWVSAASAEQPLFANSAPLGEDDLDQIRGGFDLPNGMDVSIGIEITTLVDGALALRTVLTPGATGTPSVFVGGGASAGAATGGTPAFTTPGGSVVRVVSGPNQQPLAIAGQQRLELTPNGPSVTTPSGAVQLQQGDRGATVVLAGNSLELRHMIGDFTGSLVANMANNRTIDTVVTVNVDLANSSVPVGNSILRLETIFVDAASRAIH